MKKPWEGVRDCYVFHNVPCGKRLELPIRDEADIPSHDLFMELLTRCWDKEEEARPSMQEVVQDLNNIAEGWKSNAVSGRTPEEVHTSLQA